MDGPIWVARGDQSNVEKSEITYQSSRFFEGYVRSAKVGWEGLCMAGPVSHGCSMCVGSRLKTAGGLRAAPGPRDLQQ